MARASKQPTPVPSTNTGESRRERGRLAAERVKAASMAGVEGQLRKVNLAPQDLSLRVFLDREVPTTGFVMMWGPTITPPAEAYHVGRLLRGVLPETDLVFLLTNAAAMLDGLGSRLDSRTFMPSCGYFHSLATAQALEDSGEPSQRGRWAAIALGTASLLRWTGGLLQVGGSPLFDGRWRTRFGDATAVFAGDLADGAIPLGSQELATMMRRLATLDRSQGTLAPGRRGRKPNPGSHAAVVRRVLERDRGSRIYCDEIAEQSGEFRGKRLTVRQVKKALPRVRGVIRGDDGDRPWAMLPP